VREPGRDVEGGAWSKKFGNPWTSSRDVERHLASREGARAGAGGGAVPTRSSWARLHAQRRHALVEQDSVKIFRTCVESYCFFAIWLLPIEQSYVSLVPETY